MQFQILLLALFAFVSAANQTIASEASTCPSDCLSPIQLPIKLNFFVSLLNLLNLPVLRLGGVIQGFACAKLDVNLNAIIYTFPAGCLFDIPNALLGVLVTVGQVMITGADGLLQSCSFTSLKIEVVAGVTRVILVGLKVQL